MNNVTVPNGVLHLDGAILTPETISPQGLEQFINSDENIHALEMAIYKIHNEQKQRGNNPNLERIGVWIVRLGLTRGQVLSEESFRHDLKKQQDRGVFYDMHELEPEYHPYWLASESSNFKAHARKQIPGDHTWLLVGLNL